MENKAIIAILLLVIVILVVGLCAMLFSPFHGPEGSVISIESNNVLYSGDDLSVLLTSINKTPISNEFVNVIICDSSGKLVVNETVKTDSKGSARLELDIESGKYDVDVSFGGNENYTANKTSQKLEIKEVETQEVSNAQYSSASSSSSSSSGPAVDSSGITREEAEEYGWKYTPEHGGHYIGSHDAWDEEAGVYHD